MGWKLVEIEKSDAGAKQDEKTGSISSIAEQNNIELNANGGPLGEIGDRAITPKTKEKHRHVVGTDVSGNLLENANGFIDTDPVLPIRQEVKEGSEVPSKAVGNAADARARPKPNVIVSYGKTLSITSKVSISDILWDEIPRGGFVVKGGVTFVAFYYLPILLKLLKKRFADEYVEFRGVPNVEELSRLIRHEIPVDVEKELAEISEAPVTKLLLDRKGPNEQQTIKGEIREELQRNRWIDSIWKRVRKEVVN